MKPTVIAPYNMKSNGARTIGRLLGAELISTDQLRYGEWGRKPEVIINWGIGTNFFRPEGVKTLNNPKQVGACVSKGEFFKVVSKLKGAPSIPPFTTDAKEALKWVNNGDLVMARTVDDGKQGEGILFSDDADPARFFSAPLFTKFMLNLNEYRAHVAFGKVIYWQKKDLSDAARLRGGVDFRVRTHRAGFYFMSNGFAVPDVVAAEALKMAVEFPLDFYALDIIWNRHYDKAYILEANTAMGIDEGETAAKYAEAFRVAIGD